MPVNHSLFDPAKLYAIGFERSKDIYDFSATSSVSSELLKTRLGEMRDPFRAPQAIVRIVCNEEIDDDSQLFVLYLRIRRLVKARLAGSRNEGWYFEAWIDQPTYIHFEERRDLPPVTAPSIRGFLSGDAPYGPWGAVQFITRPTR